MPVYEYYCEKCDIKFDVTKSISQYKSPESCHQCGNVAEKQFSCNIHFIGTKIEDAEYNVGLGEVTKSKRHRDELAKRKGLIEVGNEDPVKIDKNFEKSRIEKNKKSWDEV